MISVSTRDLEARSGSRHHLHFEKARVIYHQGDSASRWFEVVSGIVRTCRFMADGHRQLTGFYCAGDVFGIEVEFYAESAEAVTDVILRTLPILPTADEPGADTPRALEKALESARRSIFLFGHRTAANRVAAFLIAMAERSEFHAGLKLPMTRSDIADHLNLTLHTVSRTMSDFARKRLIAFHGRQNVQILNINGLREIAGDAPAIIPGNSSAMNDRLPQAMAKDAGHRDG